MIMENKLRERREKKREKRGGRRREIMENRREEWATEEGSKAGQVSA